jgi:SAM-dependent methyltransferase
MSGRELRFDFGENWSGFLATVDDFRIGRCEASLRQMLECDRLDGLTFLDAGSGSGLSSLAARRLGAAVRSFDLDPASVACTRALRERYRPGDAGWAVEPGSVLDRDYLSGLGRFDVVYCWGVLHHTGRLWEALDNVAALVKPGGRLFVAIYNDQGRATRGWARVKRTYNHLPRALRFLVLWPSAVWVWGPPTLRDLATGRPFRTWRDYGWARGMSPWRDLVDWVGGYPFETAKPEAVFARCRDRGLRLTRLTTCAGRSGCNEFVFTAEAEPRT